MIGLLSIPLSPQTENLELTSQDFFFLNFLKKKKRLLYPPMYFKKKVC